MPPVRNTMARAFRLPPEAIAPLHSYLEGLEGVGIVRTIAPEEGLVRVWVAPDFLDEFEQLMATLKAELKWQELDPSPPPTELVSWTT